MEIKCTAGGLLRITIDLPWTAPTEGEADLPEAFITVKTVKKSHANCSLPWKLMGSIYPAPGGSSPGIDRLLAIPSILSALRGSWWISPSGCPIGAAAQGQVHANRKKFRGTFRTGGCREHWQIVWSDEPPVKPGQREPSKKREPAPLQALGFVFDELQEARLAPVVSFKGRAAKGQEANGQRVEPEK